MRERGKNVLRYQERCCVWMIINKCKKCKFYSLDTLDDGTKEHYCSPPIYIPYFFIPCKNRKSGECRELRKMIKKYNNITG